MEDVQIIRIKKKGGTNGESRKLNTERKPNAE